VTTNWLRILVGRPSARANLFCFTHAGGTVAAFRSWPGGLPSQLQVWAAQLPGRADRLREPPIGDMPALVAALVDALAPHLDRPYAIFGHSMGAILAYEVVCTLTKQGAPLPEHLIVSGRRAAHIASYEPDLHRLPDEAFIAEINRRYGGIPRQLLHDREVMALLLPALRADIAALETHCPARREPLSLPITVFGGVDDRLAPRAHLEAWRDLTAGPCRVRTFPGGHFYLDQPHTRAALLDDLSVTLAPMLLRARGADVLPFPGDAWEACA
jgi:medium-chain acyl-[acyl-carrier-protein] hydrolase